MVGVWGDWRKWGLMRAGWLGGRAEFLVEAIVAVLDDWEKG